MTMSVIGMGGVVLMNREQDEVTHTVAAAVDAGITYFDVAPSYGNAEEVLGPALEPHRSSVTLACKTGARTAAESAHELARSLQRLRTDHLDLYQMHGLTSVEEVGRALGPGGAIETFLEAKRSGTTKLIGFSAHDEDAALMAIASGHFDTLLFPLNYRSYQSGFGPRTLAAARDRGMGIMAIKAMARSKRAEGAACAYERCWYEPEDRPDIARLQLRYTLALPGVAAAVAPGDQRLFDIAASTANATEPLSEDELATLDAATRDIAPLFANASETA
jgi:predicted aldo/keto reductase-like oxidoreductase